MFSVRDAEKTRLAAPRPQCYRALIRDCHPGPVARKRSGGLSGWLGIGAIGKPRRQYSQHSFESEHGHTEPRANSQGRDLTTSSRGVARVAAKLEIDAACLGHGKRLTPQPRGATVARWRASEGGPGTLWPFDDQRYPRPLFARQRDHAGRRCGQARRRIPGC